MNLKEATAELHSKAEKMKFNQRMFRGELSNDEYLNYLIQQSYIFQEIENRAWEVMEEADELLSESKGAKVY